MHHIRAVGFSVKMIHSLSKFYMAITDTPIA